MRANPKRAPVAASVAPVSRPVARRRRGRPRTQVAGVKNIDGHLRNKQFEIKRLLAQP